MCYCSSCDSYSYVYFSQSVDSIPPSHKREHHQHRSGYLYSHLIIKMHDREGKIKSMQRTCGFCTFIIVIFSILAVSITFSECYKDSDCYKFKCLPSGRCDCYPENFTLAYLNGEISVPRPHRCDKSETEVNYNPFEYIVAVCLVIFLIILLYQNQSYEKKCKCIDSCPEGCGCESADECDCSWNCENCLRNGQHVTFICRCPFCVSNDKHTKSMLRCCTCNSSMCKDKCQCGVFATCLFPGRLINAPENQIEYVEDDHNGSENESHNEDHGDSQLKYPGGLVSERDRLRNRKSKHNKSKKVGY